MEAKIKKCPNCSQFYHLKTGGQKKGNLPLFLTCGHSMCETCIGNIIKFAEPIECKICHRDMQVSPSDLAQLVQKKIKFYQLFPLNLLLVGELVQETLEPTSEPSKSDEDYFVDLQGIIKETDTTQGKCMECHNHTSKMCQQCATILCDTCFNKSHKNFIIFKNHVLQDIEQVLQANNCKQHSKPLDYFCKDCKKSVCMDCLVVGGEKSCKNHNVVSMQEVNVGFLEDINEISPKVDEVFRRMTKTAVDVGHLLHNIENGTGSSSELTQLLLTIEQHFSKLTAMIQKHKTEVVDTIVKLKYAEKDSLRKAKEDLEKNIKKARKVINTIAACSDVNKIKQINMSLLLDDAKQIAETPWFLTKDETNDPLKIVLNEDLCSLVSDYIHLEGNANSVYKLKTASELGPDVELPPPPVAPVYPPELPKDVRLKNKEKEKSTKRDAPAFFKNMPSYRSKSSSVSSLNSQDSNESHKSHGPMYGDGYQRPTVQHVQPFPESKHPRHLREGNQELIYITHIVNPHHFYVQRACQQSTVKEMVREFRNAVSLPQPSLNHVAEGKVYLMFNKADAMWQRCRVVSISRKDPKNPKFLVFCMDFGSTEAVPLDQLRLLAPAWVQSAPLAVRCSLANCEPKTGQWTSDDAYLIQKIVDNKQAVLHVRHVKSPSPDCVTLECDVTTFEHGISLAHALVFHDRAKMPNTRLPYPTLNFGHKEKPRLYPNHADFQPEANEEVYITQIVSPDKFFVRKFHLQKVYERLCDDLDQEYSLSDNSGMVYLPEIGGVYVVNTERQSGAEAPVSWARCVVHELPGRQRARVLLPDSGALLLVHWTTLRHIHQKFTTLSALSTECHLAGITPLNKKWSAASVALLQRFEGRLMLLHVDEANRARYSLGVTLYDRSDPDDIICVNTEMIKHKFAVSIGLYMFNHNTDTSNLVVTNRSPLDPPKQHPKKANQVTVLQKKPTKKINEKELEAKDKGPLRLEAKVLHYQSPSLVYIALVHQQKTFNELYEKIQSYYLKKKPQGKTDWAIGDRCCTICNLSKTWRRALIVDLQDGNAKVFYSDFACVETVPVASLVQLAPEFASIGDAAIKCHLCGIMPADGGEEWPTITKEYLKELFDVYQRIFITKFGDFKNNSMPIEVWVYHTIQGGALEPNKSEWRCLNRKIIEQGLAVPDKSNPGSMDAASSKDDMLSFLENVTGSIDEWLQLEPKPTKPLAEVPGDVNSPSPVECEVRSLQETSDSSNTIYITDWLPPEPFTCTEFTGMPTYIDNEGVIYLHDVAQTDTLDLIRKALDVRFKAPDPKAKYVKWVVGEPCIAMYYLDNRFYRGRVIDVNTDTQTCIVHYIDYGNEETCSFENLRKSVALHQIPTQAHKCALARIRPVAGRWDRTTLDYVHKSVVEKQCYVKVVGEPVAGVTPIELKFDKLWINDHLVEFEMAVYTDGSKAVVRKFVPTESHPPKEVAPPVAAEPESEPDYIVEESDSNSTFKSLDGKDWIEVMDGDNDGGDDDDSLEGKFLTFPKMNEDEFTCHISVINDAKTLNLAIIHDESTSVLYENLYEEIQREAENMPPLNGIFENKACIALFHEDKQWYRASILEYSERPSMIKVRYVDYGNTAVISLADVREMSPSWISLPPSTVRAALHGIEVNSQIDKLILSKQYAETFLDKEPFRVKVIAYDGELPLVELRFENGDLVYQSLIDSAVFLTTPPEADGASIRI